MVLKIVNIQEVTIQESIGDNQTRKVIVNIHESVFVRSGIQLVETSWS
jgi:hypothetical protein